MVVNLHVEAYSELCETSKMQRFPGDHVLESSAKPWEMKGNREKSGFTEKSLYLKPKTSI